MARWSGLIGFADQETARRGIDIETIVTRKYKGELMRNVGGAWVNAQRQVLPNTKVNMRISILADPYINYHCSTIRWVEWLGQHWTVSSFEVQYPRIYLTLGDVYTEQSDPEDDDYG